MNGIGLICSSGIHFLLVLGLQAVVRGSRRAASLLTQLYKILFLLLLSFCFVFILYVLSVGVVSS